MSLRILYDSSNYKGVFRRLLHKPWKGPATYKAIQPEEALQPRALQFLAFHDSIADGSCVRNLRVGEVQMQVFQLLTIKPRDPSDEALDKAL